MKWTSSELYKELESRGQMIRAYGDDRFSWEKNVDQTFAVYERLIKG